MTARITVGATAALLCLLILGCGSSGTGPNPAGPGPAPPAGPGATHTVGPMEVGAAAAGFKTLTLPSSPNGSVAFTVLYGSEIVSLREMGYGLLAFSSTVGATPSEIFTINADGTELTRLTTNWRGELGPSWSPDGTRIAFTRGRPSTKTDIFVMDADGSNITALTTDPGNDWYPAWSPDGSKIAFTSERDGPWEIYVMDADGSHETRLTVHTDTDQQPDWSPDGRQIVYGRTDAGNDDIYIMNADGSGPTRLTDNPGTDQHPDFSPDGLQIAYVSNPGTGVQIYSMRPDGSNHYPITQDPALPLAPDWSPDGRFIAYHSVRGSIGDVFISDANGSNPRNVTASPDLATFPAWCPARTAVRTLIGPPHSDGGTNPPFSTSRPLVVVGLTNEGMVSATSVGIGVPRWPTIQVAALTDIGGQLAGMKITASKISNIIEDMGRGQAVRQWDVDATPNTGAVLVFFSVYTGKVSSVVASSDTALGATAVEGIKTRGGRVILHGEFTAVWSTDRADTNLAEGAVQEVVLDARTGEVLAAN